MIGAQSVDLARRGIGRVNLAPRSDGQRADGPERGAVARGATLIDMKTSVRVQAEHARQARVGDEQVSFPVRRHGHGSNRARVVGPQRDEGE